MKQKRYWLRGAIIAVIIHVVLSGILLSVIGLHPTDNRDLGAFVFPNVFLGIPMMILIGKLGIGHIFGYWTILWLLVFYWFAIGACLGWLYGKFKTRQKVV